VSLLERFQAGSELDSFGEFTLDESAAREKMARFQLVTNEEFLMLVVQAAVASHCHALSITLEGTEVRVMARQALLDAESVRTIRAFIFDSQPDNVAYNLLAVAANAIEPSCQAPPLLAMVDEDLHFEVNLKAPLPDLLAMIKDRLRYLPCPLLLNEQPLDTDPFSENVVEFLREGTTTVTLVRFGVIVAHKTKDLPINFQAVARADQLRLDASFSHVVEDDIYQGVLRELQAQANQQLAELAKSYQPDGDDQQLLLKHFSADHMDPAGAALRGCPFFPLADRAGYFSFHDINEQISERGKIMTAYRNYNLQLQTPVLRIDDPSLRAVLSARLPSKLFQDADSEYLIQVAAARNKATWEASPRPTELPPGRYLCQAQVEGLTWEAAIGFLAAPGGPSRVDVLYQGKLITNEPIGEVPPGATAVLNVRQAQVDATWSRLEGREYRAVQKELRAKLTKLFNGQTITDTAELYPELTVHLLGELRVKKPPLVARTAPLFPTVNGESLSLGAVAALDEIAFGDAISFSQNIPAASIFPANLLTYSPDRYQALVNWLGANRVSDLRPLQARLLGIDQLMASPQPPILPAQTAYLNKRAFTFGNCTGEMALTTDHGGKVQLTIMKQGVVFAKESVPGGKVLAAVAVVEAPQLQLTAHWDGFQRNGEHAKLLTELRAEVLKFEAEMVGQFLVPPETQIKLLRAYPQAQETYWERDLFATTSYGSRASFKQLQAEIDQHGHLLRGEPGITVPNRLALVNPNKEILGFLTEKLGPVRWEEAAIALRQYQQARDFEDKPVHANIGLAGAYPVRLPVPEGRGEVSFQMSAGSQTQGEVQCYVRGRFVCRKAGLIPAPFVAALESEAFTLREDYQDVTVPDSVKTMLLDLCGQCMVAAASHSESAVQTTAWTYFGKGGPDLYKNQFRELIRLTRLDGERVSLAQVAGSKIEGYVKPGFTTTIVPKGLVLRLADSEAVRLGGYLGRTLSNLETAFEDQESYQRKLAALPTQLPRGLYRKIFEEAGLKAVLGLSMQRQTVGLDQQGRPVGRLRDLHMPIYAIVYGAEPDPKRRNDLAAELPPKGHALLGKWADQLCLDWVKEKADDRELILHLLLLSMREIGSPDNRPLSAMATLLWDMPLFPRVDGTRVSGSALAATLSETNEPVVVSNETFRVPGSAIYLPDHSEELQILTSVLGKGSLQWYEAPPLIDTEEISKSIKRLVSWGLAPIGKTVALMNRMLEKREPEPEPKSKPKPSPPKPKPKPKPEPEPEKKRDPREVLVVQLKEDIRNLLGREQYKKSNELFKSIDFGNWPLGPPIYRPRGVQTFRLNALHPGVRWLLSESDDQRHKRVARMMLLIHWVGLVNVASEELRDVHEEEFLNLLADRMTQTFAK
jgi:hypothetical protein